jgi:hypothetical protein
LTEAVYNILTELSKRRTVAKHVQQRVQIILLAFARWNNTQIARRLGLERHAVGRWRRRWSESVDALLAIEMYEPRAALERAVVAALSDAHRSGCPPRATATRPAASAQQR